MYCNNTSIWLHLLLEGYSADLASSLIYFSDLEQIFSLEVLDNGVDLGLLQHNILELIAYSTYPFVVNMSCGFLMMV